MFSCGDPTGKKLSMKNYIRYYFLPLFMKQLFINGEFDHKYIIDRK